MTCYNEWMKDPFSYRLLSLGLFGIVVAAIVVGQQFLFEEEINDYAIYLGRFLVRHNHSLLVV